MLAELITIGDEILIGQIIDSNSAWMAKKLNEIGITVKQISSVSDDRQHILNALFEAKNRADIILMTGGLGPTKDDITKKTLAGYFHAEMLRDEETLENIKRIFKKYTSRPMLDVNLAQADVPANCEVLLNQQGTAPGMWFDFEGKIYVSMPGVPFEMKHLMEDHVLPRLQKAFSLPKILHKTILTAGLGESFLAKEIEDIEDSLPPFIKLAYLPKLGQVRLRLSSSGTDEEMLHKTVNRFAGKIIERLSKYVVAEKDIAMEQAIIDFMAQKQLSLSLAESCTGGYLSSLITQHPGSSRVYQGGAVAYSNAMKESILGVKKDTLNEHGAVSEQTVTEMAEGALRNFNTDYALAVTGIAGPDGGSENKPVGTVWIAVAGREQTVAKLFTFSNKREQNIERAAISALTMLFQFLNKQL